MQREQVATAETPARQTVTDFRADWTALVRSRLAAMQVDVDPGLSDEFVRYGYYGLMNRRVTPTPRTVLLSREFQCPAEHKAGLAALQQKIELGGDITPHLSKRVDQIINDGLFDDWRITHLHLGTALKGKFVTRTGPLLYAFFTRDAAHFINVLEHGQWENVDLLNVVHTNWPEVLEQFRCPDVLSLQPRNPSPADIRTARESGLLTMLTVTDGTVYVPPGWGYTTARVPLRSVTTDDDRLDRLCRLEDAVESNFDSMRSLALEKGFELPEGRVSLRFDVNDAGEEHIVCDEVPFSWRVRGA